MEAAELLKTARKALGFSQEELAQNILVSSTTVSRWENGRSTPNRVARKVLADYCEANKVDAALVDSIRNSRW